MIEKTNATVSTVTAAIQRASASTGMNFDYLMKTAARESGMDPNAHASTSSATGLFQFLDQTWLGMVKQHGAEHGLGAYADEITQTKSGRYTVADGQTKQAILALRSDPDTSAMMAAEYTKESSSALKPVLGRDPNAGELYAAHFLGPAGATDLIKAAQSGNANAADLFPDEASANRSIFYTKSGTARSAAEVLAVLNDKQSGVEIPTSIPDTKPSVEFASLRSTIKDDNPVKSTATPIVASNQATSTATALPITLASNDSAGFASPMSSSYSASSSVVTPYMAQLLASLDPIPDRARDALFNTDHGDRNRDESRVV